jgi:glucose/mannose-6-phosphate isomerase
MFDAISGLAAQLHQAPQLVEQVDWLSYKPTTPAGVCVCGMGGSAIGGDLVRSYWEPDSPVATIVVRSDRLPAYVNRFWLVIGSSYSGNTAETLAAVGEARERGCQILALTSGGQLAEWAAQSDWPMVCVPGGLMPRAALGYSLGPVMLSLARWGIVPDRGQELANAVVKLESHRSSLGIETETTKNPAKQAALALKGRIICVYGTTGHTDVVALRLKCQFNENSKAIAFANALPELTHNEIVGVDASSSRHQMAAVFLVLGTESASALQRLNWVNTRYQHLGIPTISIVATGANRLERLLSLVQIGDYTSYYLAIAGGQDPTPIPAIAALKADLK